MLWRRGQGPKAHAQERAPRAKAPKNGQRWLEMASVGMLVTFSKHYKNSIKMYGTFGMEQMGLYVVQIQVCTNLVRTLSSSER